MEHSGPGSFIESLLQHFRSVAAITYRKSTTAIVNACSNHRVANKQHLDKRLFTMRVLRGFESDGVMGSDENPAIHVAVLKTVMPTALALAGGVLLLDRMWAHRRSRQAKAAKGACMRQQLEQLTTFRHTNYGPCGKCAHMASGWCYPNTTLLNPTPLLVPAVLSVVH